MYNFFIIHAVNLFEAAEGLMTWPLPILYNPSRHKQISQVVCTPQFKFEHLVIDTETKNYYYQ